MDTAQADLTEHLEAAEELPPEWQAWMDAEENLDTEEMAVPKPAQPWRIDHDNTATWAFRKLWAARREIERIDAAAEHEIDRIREWAKTAAKRHVRAEEFFEHALVDYLIRLQDAGKADKSYKLPAGTIESRAGSKRVEVTDAEAFIAWALANRTELLKVEPRKTDIKKALTEKDGLLVDGEVGEIVPGVEIVVGEPSYSAKPANLE